MSGEGKDGEYCTICGGIPPDRIDTKRIMIDGKETGIDHLDFILDNVRELHLSRDSEIAEEILKRVNKFNYVPTKKEAEYSRALLEEYRRRE